MADSLIHQLVIVGAGPGGLSAGIYAARARIDTVLLEKGAAGGQVLVTDWIDNYPGFSEGVSGFDLAERMRAHAERFGLTIASKNAVGMDLATEIKAIHCEDGTVVEAYTVIVATGARPNHLGAPGELELTGKGVSYCATCDGPFFRDQEIAVIGGGDSALQEAVYLTKFAKSVTVIHRRQELRAAPIIQEAALAHERISFLYDAQVSAILGEKEVEALQIRYRDGREETRPFQGVFILVGITPNTESLPMDQLKHEQGFIVTDGMMRTNIAGVMAVGDIRHDSIRQVVSAAGEGAVAAKAAEHYLESIRH